jgi:hypothetical protein
VSVSTLITFIPNGKKKHLKRFVTNAHFEELFHNILVKMAHDTTLTNFNFVRSYIGRQFKEEA